MNLVRFSFFLLLVFAFSSISSVNARAEDKSKAAPEKSSPKTQENTPLKKWMDAENALIDPLSEKDKESFFILRNKHSIIRVTKIVERDIGNAVKSCSDKNPSMKEKMGTRFDQWKNAVMPILDTAKKMLDQDLEAQKLVDLSEAKKVLKLNDEAYEYGEKQTTKIPVSTVEACEGLLKSMDRTEDEMVTLLQQTLLPESVIRQRSQDREKGKVKAQLPAEKKAE